MRCIARLMMHYPILPSRPINPNLFFVKKKSPIIDSYVTPETNRLKMYLLLKMVIFQCHVSFIVYGVFCDSEISHPTPTPEVSYLGRKSGDALQKGLLAVG